MKSVRKMILVQWADAHSNDTNAWLYPDEVKDKGEYLVETIGWILEPGKGGQTGHLSLVQSIGSDDALDAIINIPLGMVRSVSVLEGKRVRLDSLLRRAAK